MQIKRITLMIAFGVLTLVAAVAQEDPEPSRPQAEQQETERGSSTRRRNLSEDDFRPSERVSEDYPVPFPTDI